MQPFKRFRFVHNNKELNYSAIPELNDFFIKEAWELLIYLTLRPSTAHLTDINNSPRPSILEDISMSDMNIYNKEGT